MTRRSTTRSLATTVVRAWTDVRHANRRMVDLQMGPVAHRTTTHPGPIRSGAFCCPEPFCCPGRFLLPGQRFGSCPVRASGR